MSHAKKKKKPIAILPNKSDQSVTSLVSVKSNEADDDEDDPEPLDDIPKSQISIKSVSSDPSTNQIRSKKKEKSKKKAKFKKRKGEKKSKRESSLKREHTKKVESDKEVLKKEQTKNDEFDKDESDKEEMKKSESKKKQVKKTDAEKEESDKEEMKKDESKKEIKSSSKQKRKLKIRTLCLSSKRSSEPPPTLEENSLQFTPSEINLYLDNEKDLFGTTITKKQHNLVLENLKTPYSKIPPFKPKDNLDSYDQAQEDLENLIFSSDPNNSLERNKSTAKDKSVSPEKDLSPDDESEISREITARFENLIMDPSIFEKAANTSPDNATIEIQQQTSPISPTQSTSSNPSITSDQQIEITNEQALKEQIDNAIVLFTYKSRVKKEKKKKKRKKKADIRVGLIGAGKMTEAIVNSLINSLKFEPNSIFISSPSGRNLDLFKAKGCQTTKRNIDIFTRYFCHIIFINVHGGTIRYCYKLGGIKPFPLTTTFLPVTRHRYYIFSLVTGVTLDEIKNTIFNPDQTSKYQFEMHRILLNVCCLYGKSICGIDCEINQLSPVIKIFLEKFGELEFIPEKEMDAACAIGGCGLAFSYYFLNAISDGSVRIGLGKEISIRLVAQIANSSVECLKRTQDIDKFYKFFTEGHTSTLVGIEHLKKQEIGLGIENAVKAAYDRIVELAKMEISPQFE